MIVTPSVETYGELEVLKFIEDKVKTNKGVLIDARTPSWYKRGTIPSSVNIPFTIFSLGHNDERLITAMKKIGVERRIEKLEGYWTDLKDMIGIEKKPNPYWDFSNAKNLLLWCNGMWCGQSPRAIRGLIKLGYPVEKIKYYRAGMQDWRILGLTVVTPK
jgi:rhodanese-related sulfurtransferase